MTVIWIGEGYERTFEDSIYGSYYSKYFTSAKIKVNSGTNTVCGKTIIIKSSAN